MAKMRHILLLTVTLTIFVDCSASDDCGRRPGYSSLVIGGEAVEAGDWPWIAGVFYQNNTALQFLCGATLVSRTAVVTAAHCVRSRGHTFPANTLVVVMGRHAIFNWTEAPGVQTRHAREVVVHPTFLQSKLSGADVAIIKFLSAVSFTAQTRPTCMGQNLPLGGEGTVVGWGMDERGYSTTEEPRLTREPIVSRQVCIDSHEDFQDITNDYSFCAGKQNGTGPCNGDSGSGMFVSQRLPKGTRWFLVGLVSRSLSDEQGLCDLQHYVVYMDLVKLAGWIRQEIGGPDACQAVRDKARELQMTKLGDKYYYVDASTWKPWTATRDFCRSHGLELVSVESKEENDLLIHHLKTVVPEDQGNLGFWLGGSDEGHEGRWTWSDTGRDFTFTDWGKDEPNNVGGSENCVILAVKKDGVHWWEDRGCWPDFRILCEAKLVCPS